MPNDAAARDALASLLAERFGEELPVPDDVSGLDVLLHIARHRTHRSYAARPVDRDLLRLVTAVALSAPSKSDLQQADILEVREPEKRRVIASLIPSMSWIAAAPAFLVVCGNGRRLLEASALRGTSFANRHLDHFFNASVDAALVLQTLILAAEAVGLGCCPISVIRNHAARVSELLELPDHVFPLAGLCLGWPDQPGKISPRLPLSQTLQRDRHDDSGLPQALEAYDRRRGRAEGHDPDSADFVGWSTAKARMYAKVQREDFGRFIEGKGFKLV